MTERDSPVEPERIRMAKACSITGLEPRRMQQKAERGEIPGAVKIDGLWTFNESQLRAWVKALEDEQCQGRKAAAGAAIRRTPSGAATSSSGARGSRASSGGGRYAQAMSNLQHSGSRRTSRV